MFYTVGKDGKSKGIIYKEVTEEILAHHEQYGEKIYKLDRLTRGDETEGCKVVRPADELTEAELKLAVTLFDVQKNDILLESTGQEVTKLKISNIQKDQVINSLGQELTNIKIQLITMKGGV